MLKHKPATTASMPTSLKPKPIVGGAKRPGSPSAHKLAAKPPTHQRDQTAMRSGSKIDTLLKLMKGKSGATIDQLVRATGWQAHSVRGAISGTVKKKLGLDVQSRRVDGVRIYRIGK